jgi:hypothetical protein
LLTKRNKELKVKEEVYRLDEAATIQIHNAEHIVSSNKKVIKPTRLFCVVEIDNIIHWSTVGLSNFIQPHEYEIIVALNEIRFVFFLSRRNPQSMPLNGITTSNFYFSK